MTTETRPTPKTNATLEDLYQEPGKAEIVNGEIVRFMATGKMPNYAAGAAYVSLFLYIKANRLPGTAATDNGGFAVSLPNRESFSPDASYYVGPDTRMRFFQGAPLFAIEVRSENDYGYAAEMNIAAKRRDYFAAGTLVVWDVDLQSVEMVRKYSADAPEHPVVFRRGDLADAEPAVPGWSMPVEDLFETG